MYSENISMIKYRFIFYSETARYFDYSIMLIPKYIKNGKLFKDKSIYLHLRNNNLQIIVRLYAIYQLYYVI